MRLRSLVFGVLVLSLAAASATAFAAAEDAQWLRYPAISPDGETVVFSYRGDLWTVPAAGGRATQLTIHAAHEFMPVWSPDGSKIAFASDRYGNYDIFVMPAEGGAATRLTFHSASDFSASFTPDGEHVLFWSGRLDAQSMVGYPRRGAQPELYSVALTGGMPKQVLTTPALYAVWDSTGTRMIYSDEKGLETEWRKHDNSSFARDVWIYDAASGEHTQLTEFGADDRQPVWAPGDETIYYLSERDGSFNVWSLAVDDPEQPAQITDHDTHPVRFLSISDAGDLCYGFDGAIYVRPQEPTPAAASTSPSPPTTDTTTSSPPTWPAASPTSISRPTAARSPSSRAAKSSSPPSNTATPAESPNTPEQERSVTFHPNGRGLLYASETGRQLEHLPHRSHRQRRAELLQRHGLRGKAGARHRARDLPAPLLPRRQGGRLPRGTDRPQGPQPGIRRRAGPSCPATSTTPTPTATSGTSGRPTASGSWSSS